MSFRSRALSAFFAIAAIATIAPSAWSLNCTLHYGACTTDITVVEYTDEPTVICQVGHPVVQITAYATCSQGNSGPAVDLRCGTSSEAFVWSGSGVTHKLAPRANWESVLARGCRQLLYKNSSLLN